MPADRPLPERPLLLAGAALSAATLAAALVAPCAVLTGWLAGAVAASAVPAGALGLLLLMRLVPGAWSRPMRPMAEATTLLLPAAALAFLPVLLGLGWIYPWATAPLTGFRGVLLSLAAFILLALARFAALVAVAREMRRRRTAAMAAAGLLLLPPLAHVAAVQWLLSRDPGYASAAIGLQFLARELVIGWCVLLIVRLSTGRPPARIGVLGGVLLALLVGWGYLTFMAFLVGWSSNLPEAAGWYAARSGGWDLAEIAFALLAAAPALLLFSGRIRRSPGMLRALAALALTGQLVELAWSALPGTGPAGVLAYLASLAGLACLTAGALPHALRRRLAERWP